jgi:hypothetical protein
MKSRTRLMLPSILCFCSCAYVGALQEWNPSRAANDADRDIAAGRIRFAYIGGRASHAPGLPEGSYRIVSRYPRLLVGPQGCNHDNGTDIRADYARRYNVRMWAHVSGRASSNQATETTLLSGNDRSSFYREPPHCSSLFR